MEYPFLIIDFKRKIREMPIVDWKVKFPFTNHIWKSIYPQLKRYWPPCSACVYKIKIPLPTIFVVEWLALHGYLHLHGLINGFSWVL